jgi:exonuclease SbcC
VRPLKLRLAGLRSYVTERQVDFTGVDLAAIVGDTGAGKSSILEALCVALYGSCSWDKGSVKPLISDGASILRVELEFLADHRRWRVTRATSRTAYPPPIHELVCLEDAGERYDNAGPVNRRIRQLVGLDVDQFLRAVVLPQGRFQALLQATGGERSAILKGIFRLDALAAVRATAQGTVERLRPRLEDLRVARAGLLPDPLAAADDARGRLRRAEVRATALGRVRDAVAGALEAGATARRRADELDRHGQALDVAELRGGADALERLREPAAAFAGERRRLVDEREDHRARMRRLGAERDERRNRGEDAAGLTRVAALLERLADETTNIVNAGARLATEAEQLAEERRRVDQERADLEALTAAASHATAEHANAMRALEEAHERLRRAREQLADARRHGAAAGEAAAAVAGREAELGRLRERARRLADDADAARRRELQAGERLDQLRRRHAAAHLAATTGPGDPCPVCDRVLPDDFIPPPAPTEEAGAAADAHAAREAADAAAAAAAGASSDVRAAERELAACRGRTGEMAAAAAEALDALRAALPALPALPGRPALPAAGLAGDEELLAPLVDLVSEARVVAEDRRRRAERARSQADHARGAIAPVEQALSQRGRRHERDAEELRAREAARSHDLARLPVAFRPAGEPDVRRLRQLATLATEALSEACRLEDELDAASRAADRVTERIEDADRRRESAVDEPRRLARSRLARLHARAMDAAGSTGLAIPAWVERNELAAEADAAARLEAAATDISAACRGRAEAARGDADAAERRARDALAGAGVADLQALEAELVAAAAARAQAADDLERAEREAPLAADLDRRISEGGGFLQVLDELARQLTDGRFIGYAVERRQRTLLAVASEILGDMTANRYGFAADFQIVDRVSGRPRSVKTLSGGETFLASLALALGLVELANRGGGRLEALFLDEGFGALDANALDAALDELQRRAAGGRLIAVISHLRAVAERIEHVLLVRRTVTGSDPRWIGRPELTALVEADLDAGLLA